jgi:hypothetical protein
VRVLRSVGLWRAVLLRIRADWPVVAAAWLLLACATTLVATTALYGDAVALGGLRQALLAAPPTDRTINLRMLAAPADLPAIDRAATSELQRAVATSGGEVSLVEHADPYGWADQDPASATDLAVLGSYANIERHARLVAGGWPKAGASPVEAALATPAADALHIAIGDHVALVSRRDSTRRLTLIISGTWRPIADDPYWTGDLDVAGADASSHFVNRGPFVVAQTDLLGVATTGRIDVEWRTLPDLASIPLDATDELATGVNALRDRLASSLPGRPDFRLITTLPTILTQVGRSATVSRSGIGLLALQFAVLAGYAIVLVAGVLVDKRRAEADLLRSRGANAGHLALMALIEAVLLAVTAAAVAPLAALVVVQAVIALGPLGSSGIAADVAPGPATFGVAAATAAAAILALAVPTIMSLASPAGVRAAIGRQVGRTLPQRLGIDLILVVLAVIALWQLRLYGAPLTRNTRGVLGADPLLVAAPAIGLLGGAVVAVRIVPRLGELAERLLIRRRGAVAPLGGHQLARRPLRYTRSALLLMLAVALGTFAIAQDSTWARSQSDQATYQAATDVRMQTADYSSVPDWAVGPIERIVPGVSAAMPVERLSLDVGRAFRDGTVLAVDAPRVATFLRQQPADVSAPLSSLMASLAADRPQLPLTALPGRPARLGVTLDADLRPFLNGSFASELEPSTEIVGASAVVVDADGRLSRFTGTGQARAVSRGQRLELALTTTASGGTIAPTYPLNLQAIELTFATIGIAQGTVEFTGLGTSDTATGTSWTAVPFDAGASGWSWTRISNPDFSGVVAEGTYDPPADAPGRIVVEVSNDDPYSSTLDGTVYRLSTRASSTAEVPAMASTSFLRATGLTVGDRIGVSAGAHDITVRIAGSVGTFPPLDPDRPFLVVDEPTLDQIVFADDATTGIATEWWIATAPGQEAAVAAAIGAQPRIASQVISRSALAGKLASDPIALGVIGALGLGALAATLFATIGFLVSAAASANERLGEFALLRALGLSGRQLSAWLSFENACLLAVGLLAGSGLGLVLAWLVLPFSTLTASGAAPIPAPEVVIPWAAFGPIYALGLGVFAVTVFVVVRQVRGTEIGGILRGQDE